MLLWMIAILGYIEKKTLLDYSLNTQKGRRACSECARERERERARASTQVVRMGDVREQAEIGPGDEELDAALEMELAASFLKHPSSVSLPPMSVCVFLFGLSPVSAKP